MAQNSEPTDGQPSEQTPLLSKAVDTNGHGSVSISAAEVPVGEPLTGNGANGAVLKTGTDDEESQGQGEVEDPTDRSHVARIISVLLIGTSWSALATRSVMTANGSKASLSRTPTARFFWRHTPLSHRNSTIWKTRAG